MKVLFAVSNEEISESIVRKYQKQYKQIISYKNVYYFNAIVKELQKDKTYDRIVISEDLEAFTNSQYDQIDKFIFEKLDSISDEASNSRGNDIPIILICSDRRTKSEQILVKLFGIGIYNAIIGGDRSIEEVCRLINRPRVKKEAKIYYKIDSEEVNYQPENENDVSEMEIQNILAYYKRLGKDEDKYVESFDKNIATQYNDTQLRIISKFLPLNVRAVLEERSAKYQQIMSFNNSVSATLRKPKNEEKEQGTSETLLKIKNEDNILKRPVVIPQSVNLQGKKKLAKTKVHDNVEVIENNVIQEKTEKDFIDNDKNEDKSSQNFQKAILENSEAAETIEKIVENINESETLVKKKRGRPRKTPVVSEVKQETPKRGRGRPRKNANMGDNNIEIKDEVKLPNIADMNNNDSNNESILPGFDEQEEKEEIVLPGFTGQEEKEEVVLPGFSEQEGKEEVVLPGFSEQEEKEEVVLPGFTGQEEKEEVVLPGFTGQEEKEEVVLPGFGETENAEEEKIVTEFNNHEIRESVFPEYEGNNIRTGNDEIKNSNVLRTSRIENLSNYNNDKEIEEQMIDLSGILTLDKKIVCCVGTTKNGTSFIVNNVAEILASKGVKVAILDITKNKNSYYIYTKNEEELRNIATTSFKELKYGNAKGIEVNRNLSVFTSLPGEDEERSNIGKILETLVMNYSLILIDADFDSPNEYFNYAQEIYLIQSLDILTIQPLTAFLRKLKEKNILKQEKIRIVLNKTVKLRGINDKTIIGGMAYYNDPTMSYMTELFDRNEVKYLSIPFDEEVYTKYLEGIINCDISIKGYSKQFLQVLTSLTEMIYPVIETNNTYRPPDLANSAFSPSINNTLDQMKKRY